MKCKNCVYYVHMNDDEERTIGTPNWCFYISDSPDEELERDCIKFKFLTNADRIRAMTDEELAEWLSDMHDSVTCFNNGAIDCNPSCKRCWLEWLKQELCK